MSITMFSACLTVSVLLLVVQGCPGHNHDHDHGEIGLHSDAVHDHHGHHHTHEHEADRHHDFGETSHGLSEQMLDVIAGSITTSIAPIVVIPLMSLVVSPRSKSLDLLIAFAAGSMMGDVCLHIIPSIVTAPQHEAGTHDDDDHHHRDHHGHVHFSPDATRGMLSLLLGFALFYVADGMFSSSKECCSSKASSRSKQQRVKESNQTVGSKEASKAWLSLVADFTHNVADGVVLGLGAAASRGVLISKTLVVLSHELPHEIGDFAVLSSCGWELRDVVLSQLVTASGNLLGCVLSLALHHVILDQTELSITTYLEPFVGGSFLYLSTVSLMGDLASRTTGQRDRIWHMLCFGLGVLAMLLVTEIEALVEMH